LPGAAKTFSRRPFMPSLRRCSFALCRDWIDRNMTTHLSRRNAMNTHNVNVNTATPESPKTWEKSPSVLWCGRQDDLMTPPAQILADEQKPFVVTVSGRREEQGDDGWHTATLTLGHTRSIAEALETAAAAWLSGNWDPCNEYLVPDTGPVFFEPETLIILDDTARTVLLGDTDSLVWHMPPTETDGDLNSAWLGHPAVTAAVGAFVPPERKPRGSEVSRPGI